jgi:hypothetical protein
MGVRQFVPHNREALIEWHRHQQNAARKMRPLSRLPLGEGVHLVPALMTRRRLLKS